MNLFESLVGNATLGEMPFGINDNCYVKSVELTRAGEKKHTFIKFVQLDGDDDATEFVAGWWAIDPTKKDFAFSNFREYITQLIGILDCFYDVETVRTKFNDLVFSSYESLDAVQEACVSNKGARELTKLAQEGFNELITPFVGDKENLIRVKVVTDRNGRRADIPSFRVFTESMKVEETKLFITPTEQSRRDTVIETQAKAEKEMEEIMGDMPIGDAEDMGGLGDSLELPDTSDDLDEPMAGGVDDLLSV